MNFPFLLLQILFTLRSSKLNLSNCIIIYTPLKIFLLILWKLKISRKVFQNIISKIQNHWNNNYCLNNYKKFYMKFNNFLLTLIIYYIFLDSRNSKLTTTFFNKKYLIIMNYINIIYIIIKLFSYKSLYVTYIIHHLSVILIYETTANTIKAQ